MIDKAVGGPRRWTGVATAVLVAAAAAQESPAPMGQALVFEADLAAGRALGWIAPGTSDDDAVAAAVDVVRARFRQGTGKFVEAQVEREGDRRLYVVFIGPLGDADRTLVVDGVTNPGRIVLRPVVDAATADLAAERIRLDAWRKSHADRPLVEFAALAPVDGGPAAGLVWLPRRPETEPPVAVATSPGFAIAVTDTEKGFRMVPRTGGLLSLRLELRDEAMVRLRAWSEPLAGREVAVVVNGVVTRIEPVAERIGPGVEPARDLTLPELRGLLMALAGGALPAPLRLVGSEERPVPTGLRHRPKDGG